MISFQARGRRLAPSRALARGLLVMMVLTQAVQAPVYAQSSRRNARPPAAPPAQTAEAGDTVTLNFRDTDVEQIVGAFGYLLGRTIVIDPRVRGRMTLETPGPVTHARAWMLLQSALRSMGFAVVETGALTKVVPEADAKLQSGPVTSGRIQSTDGDQIVTQIFRLANESATNLVPVLRPLIAPNNTIVAYPNNNSLVITDYASNLQRVGRIIASLDSPASGGGVEVIPIEYAVASDVAVAANRLLDDTARASAGAQVDAGQRVMVMADPRTNTIMIRANSAAKMSLARSLITKLDQPSVQPGNVYVVYLRNAEAVKLAQTLRGVLAGQAGAGGAGQPGAGGFGGASGGVMGATGAAGGFGAAGAMGASGALGSAAQGANRGAMGGQGAAGGAMGSMQLQQSSLAPVTVQAGAAVIAADPATNSLIITAPEPVYRNLRNVIDQLDMRRAQVYIESLIVEISAERAAELGVQWQFLQSPEGSTRVIGGTNLPARGTGANILDVTSNPGAMGTGLNVGVVRGTVNVPGIGEVINLGLLARALESQASANILATPNLLTLDNEEARIIIGQNVPFVTGQFTLSGAGTGNVNPFQTIERRDVGTTLHVKPQISDSGTVRLQIFQEVSSVQSTTLASGIITNRRAIESTVLVDDGQIIVLGGLIEERIQGGQDKVPGLGDIPVLGQLFRYDNRRRVKTNLLVFLRPVIVRDSSLAHGVTSDRYEYMRSVRSNSALPEHWALPSFPPSELPGMPPAPGQAIQRGAPASWGLPPLQPVAPGTRPLVYGADAVGPASLSPDIDASVPRDPAPVYESRPSTMPLYDNRPLNLPEPRSPISVPVPAAPPSGQPTPLTRLPAATQGTAAATAVPANRSRRQPAMASSRQAGPGAVAPGSLAAMVLSGDHSARANDPAGQAQRPSVRRPQTAGSAPLGTWRVDPQAMGAQFEAAQAARAASARAAHDQAADARTADEAPTWGFRSAADFEQPQP